MKAFLLLFSLIFVNTLFAQKQVIKITDQTSKKEVIIKENKRIKVMTQDGRKLSGRFKVEGVTTISLNGTQIELSDIKEIKRNPLLGSLLISGALVYVGVVVMGVAVIAGVFADSTAFLLMIPAAGMIYGGLKSPNLFKKYTDDGHWTFELITTP